MTNQEIPRMDIRHEISRLDFLDTKAADFQGKYATYTADSDSQDFVPMRERTWGDHDEPWQYQPYHLSDLQKKHLSLEKI